MHHFPELSAVPVFFSDDTVVAEANSYSPSAGKPALVVRDWRDHQFPIDIKAVTPVTREQLSLAHDRAFVDAILDSTRKNGFGNTLASVARSLPFTSGALLCAAREALQNRRVACAPVCPAFITLVTAALAASATSTG